MTWNKASRADLPPKRPRDRLRLWGRMVFAVTILAVALGMFLPARAMDIALQRIAGRPVSRLGAHVVRLWARIALPTLGLRLRITGVPMQVPGAYVANHSSWIDIIALQAAAAPFLVSKADVRGWPVIGAIGRLIGTLFIERHPSALRQQQDDLRGRIVAGDRMALFPEGTSSDGRRILPFKSALFEVFFAPAPLDHAAVQPVAIRYRPRGDLPADFYGWWGDADFGGHLSDVLARSAGGTVTLSFLETLPVAAMAGRKDAARTAEEMVRREFDRLSADAH